jgi:hypothetical protein
MGMKPVKRWLDTQAFSGCVVRFINLGDSTPEQDLGSLFRRFDCEITHSTGTVKIEFALTVRAHKHLYWSCDSFGSVIKYETRFSDEREIGDIVLSVLKTIDAILFQGYGAGDTKPLRSHIFRFLKSGTTGQGAVGFNQSTVDQLVTIVNKQSGKDKGDYLKSLESSLFEFIDVVTEEEWVTVYRQAQVRAIHRE